MSCTKITGADVYSVRNRHEWATIVVRCWQDESGGELRHRGEILINSTFGSWANYWSAPGMPFKRFLLGLDFGYCMQKLMGRDLQEHDGDATLKALRRSVLEARRNRRLDKSAAAWVWQEIEDRSSSLADTVESFVSACGDIQRDAGESWNRRQVGNHADEIGDLFAEPWYMTETRDNPQAVGFWRELWPEFIATLRAEVAAEQEAAHV